MKYQKLASVLAFLIGYELLLPTSTINIEWFKEVHFEPPYLLTRMEIFNGFFLKDIFAIIYIILMGTNYKNYTINSNLLKISKIYYLLFFYGILIAIFTNNHYDLFENFRLLIIILTVICLNQSVKKKTINAFIIGVSVSGMLNLIVSYNVDLYQIKPIFFLVNQNGPGPIAAILLLLFYEYNIESKLFKAFKVILLLIALLSLSKIAYLMLVCFFLQIIDNLFKSQNKRFMTIYIVLAIVGFFSIFQAIYDKKFSENRFALIDNGGDQTRIAYFTSSIKILFDNPLGVSYSGFYNAVSKTSEFKENKIIEINKLRANPHSTFLYYLCSHGIFGMIMMILFLSSLFSYRNFRENLFLNISVTLFLLTIPFLFVSYFFILPLTLLYKK